MKVIYSCLGALVWIFVAGYVYIRDVREFVFFLLFLVYGYIASTFGGMEIGTSSTVKFHLLSLPYAIFPLKLG